MIVIGSLFSYLRLEIHTAKQELVSCNRADNNRNSRSNSRSSHQLNNLDWFAEKFADEQQNRGVT